MVFHGEYDGNAFTLVEDPQDGLERRKRHPSGVQQKKLMALLWTCVTYYNPCSFMTNKYSGNNIILIIQGIFFK